MQNRNFLKDKSTTTHLEISQKMTSYKIKKCVSSEIAKSGQLKKYRVILFSVIPY